MSEEKLELCPDCGEKQLLPPSPLAKMRLCLGCGVVPKPTSRTATSELMEAANAA